jgi:hypothetical protein
MKHTYKKTCLFITILFLFTFFEFTSAQELGESAEGQNWLRQYKVYGGESRLFHRFDLYSKQDIEIAKLKLTSLVKSKDNNEWEGIYHGIGSEVGFTQLRWNRENGFLYFEIYTCLPELRQLNFGKVVDSPETVKFIPEYSEDSPRKKTKADTLVKVSWGKRRYLVEESSLESFYEKVVGIYVDPNNDLTENDEYITPKWFNFWVNNDVYENLPAALPSLPKGYEKYKRLPIQSKIISVGSRTIEEGKTLGGTSYGESSFLEVTIGVGRNNGVKVGMTFEIPKVVELITITQVENNKAVGLIQRNINESKKDSCHGENYKDIPCPKISVGLKVQTQIGLLQ